MAFWPKGEIFFFGFNLQWPLCLVHKRSWQPCTWACLAWYQRLLFWVERSVLGIPPELNLKGPNVRSHATWRREIQSFYTMQAALIVLPWFLDCLAKQQYVPSSSSIASHVLASIHQYTIWRIISYYVMFIYIPTRSEWTHDRFAKYFGLSGLSESAEPSCSELLFSNTLPLMTHNS